MKGSICITICLLLLFLQTQNTILTYIIQQEVDQADTFVELTAKIQVDGPSLQKSVTTAHELITSIKQIVAKDCEKGAKKSEIKECQELVEDSKFEVEPKYHLVRKIPTFTLFILTHEVVIKIKNIKGLGKLIDRIVEEGQDLITLKELAWKTQNEIDPEVTALKDGLAEGKELCKKIGKGLEQVISVEELQEQEQEDEEEDDEKDPDLTQAQVQNVIFKFKVVCSDKSTDKKAK